MEACVGMLDFLRNHNKTDSFGMAGMKRMQALPSKN
jgi:hypothetical protein